MAHGSEEVRERSSEELDVTDSGSIALRQGRWREIPLGREAISSKLDLSAGALVVSVCLYRWKFLRSLEATLCEASIGGPQFTSGTPLVGHAALETALEQTHIQCFPHGRETTLRASQ